MAVLCIQTWWRKVFLQRKYELIRNSIIGIQTLFRGKTQRKKY